MDVTQPTPHRLYQKWISNVPVTNLSRILIYCKINPYPNRAVKNVHRSFQRQRQSRKDDAIHLQRKILSLFNI